MVELRILGGGNWADSSLSTLGFSRVGLGLFRDLLVRIPWIMVLERRVQEISKFYLLQAPG